MLCSSTLINASSSVLDCSAGFFNGIVWMGGLSLFALAVIIILMLKD